MNDKENLIQEESEEAQVPPAHDVSQGIVSVNSRGPSSGGNAGKVIFIIGVVAMLVLGSLWGFNKWRAMNRSKESVSAEQKKNENKPAQVGQRRLFGEEPPPLPGQSTPSAAASAPAAVGAVSTAPVVTPCPGGDQGQPALDPNGKQVVAPGGQAMRVCKDGRIFVPAVQARPGEALGQVQPSPVVGGGTNNGGQKAPSRYAGDALVPSPMNIGAGGGQGGQSQDNSPKAQADAIGGVLDRVLNQGGNRGASPNPYGSAGSMGPNGTAGGSDTQTKPIGDLLKSADTPAVLAGKITDQSMILPKGRSIDCALSTRVINEVSGMASCVVTGDVYSANGRVLLIERGSEVTGEYTAAMTQGQRRLFVLWSRVRTPNGVVVNVNSPAADGLGTAGLDGYVDNRWPERIGAAFLLSLVQDVISYETMKVTPPGGQNAAAATTETGNKMVEKVLESTINIKPTLYKNQGDRASIFVARDLDFGAVYALRQR